MKMAHQALLLVLLALASSLALATDPSQLQDFCVADINSTVLVNGFVCKNPVNVTVDDFFFSGLDKPGTLLSKVGSKVTPVFVGQLPGLNTLGIAMARVDFGPFGLNPPHTHPRATEIFTVLEGSLFVGFVTSNPPELFTKQLHKGDVFVFPQGLIHFEFNNCTKNAIGLATFSSQNPGVNTIATAIFGSTPLISDDVLSKAFSIDKNKVHWIESLQV